MSKVPNFKFYWTLEHFLFPGCSSIVFHPEIGKKPIQQIVFLHEQYFGVATEDESFKQIANYFQDTGILEDYGIHFQSTTGFVTEEKFDSIYDYQARGQCC